MWNALRSNFLNSSMWKKKTLTWLQDYSYIPTSEHTAEDWEREKITVEITTENS
jgi:hypothetical protein